MFKYHNLDSYVELIEGLKAKSQRKTLKSIGFSSYKLFDDINPEYIIRRFGKPNYTFDKNKKSLGIEVYFYKQVLGSHRTKLEIHFYQNVLFLYSYTFSYLCSDDKAEVKRLYEKKYLNHCELNVLEDYIINRNNFIISFSDNIDFTVTYFNSEASILNNVYELVNKEKRLERSKKIESKSRLYARI
jgi:hypothetical protein